MTEFSPGDIIEIETPNGLAYLQVTHRHSSYPEVVRVLPGLHASPSKDLSGLASRKTAFTVMIPLGGAIGQKRITGRKVGAAAIPASDRAFPTFKMAIRDKRGAIAYWWFWDGDSLRYDESPGPEANAMEQREVMTADALMARIAAMEDAPALS